MKGIPKIKKEKVDQAPGMKSKLRSRKVKAIISFILVIVLAFVVLPMIYSSQSETGTVAVVKSPISKGEEITAEKFSMETVGTYGLSKSVILLREDIIGKKALVDMVKGDLIMAEKIGKSATDPLMDAFVEEGNRLVTVSIKSNAAGLASHLERGDIVNVACVQGIMDEYGYQTGVQVLNYPELKHLEVYDAENAQTDSVDKEKESGDNNADPIIHTITFVATDWQAQKLLEAEYTGTLHVIFVAKDRTQIPPEPVIEEELEPNIVEGVEPIE